MLAFAALLLLLPLGPLLQPQFTLAAESVPRTLNITTIAANPQKQSVLECWRLTAPLLESSVPGTSGAVFAQLGQGNATSYGLIPPRFNGGLHNAPAIQWVAFTAGEAVVSFPNSSAEATIHGGRNGLILAADIASVSTYGHITMYPSNRSTVVIQIPLANNKVPEHTVLYEGPCRKEEQNS
ncbi:hypothetical protein GJ744_005653 [Endocarpon pusillum]|uniref:Small secreted protein n=1 Tax=Endocarpon pusillum TaxID=364733 RepID=A0A8H7E114_9EURO|nr:hypothetical protein GJ744_005653 [Endocarpon pusillum]